MAISPGDLKPKRDEKVKIFNEMVSAEEKKIDEELLRVAPEPGERVSVELSLSVSKRIVEALVKMYSERGWKVTLPEQSRSGPRILAFEYSEKGIY